MAIKESISRTIKRLNLRSTVMKLPIFGQAIYDGLSEEFDRVNDFRTLVKVSTVANENMDPDTIEDYEHKFGIEADITAASDERIDRIIEAAQRDGNGGPDWLQEQIQKAGFDLYVILNENNVSQVFQFGDFQFGSIQFGGAITYLDPRTVDGELVTSSPNGNIGPQFEQFGPSFQFGPTQQFGNLVEGFANPRPRPFVMTSNPDLWGYFFFLSPFSDRLAGPTELLSITEQEWTYLNKLIMQLKHLRNWAIVQVEVS